MRTLYVSDLDGTLLRSDQRTSDFTNETLRKLTQQGTLFSYATARSLVTARKATKGLDAKIPLIVYNGAFVMDNHSGEILLSNFFDTSVKELLADLMAHDVYPIVYSFLNGVERFSYLWESCSPPLQDFIRTRRGDPREHPVTNTEELFTGDIFYLTCIDEAEKLAPIYEKYKNAYRCLFQKDLYSGEQWLEFMPQAASKSNAIRQLKKLLQCDRLVVFGDGINDMDMFLSADESYAVENAVPELKKIATGIIEKNDDDAVARWLLENCSAI